MKHIFKPWRERQATGTVDRHILDAKGLVCIIPYKENSTERRAAIARLITAAPDLLEALENLINASDHISPFGGESSVKAVRLAGKYMKAFDEARAALACAQGEEQ